MAIKNPESSDFKNNQRRALDYQQFRTTSDILRAVAEFYKAVAFRSISDGALNFLTNGFDVTAWIDNSDSDDNKIDIEVSKGIALLDNQTVQMTEDFIFEYDKPDSDKNYYVYLYYKYIEEYPANYAQIKILTSETTSYGYSLIAKVFYDADADTVTVNDSPRNALISKYVQPAEPTSGKLIPSIAQDGDIIAGDKLYFVDTSGGAVTLTLDDQAPASSTLSVFDIAGTFDTNNVTIKAPDGYTIEKADQYVVDKKSSCITFQLRDPDSDKNWYMTNYNIYEDIVTLSDDQIIKGVKTFQQDIYMNDSHKGVVLTDRSDSSKQYRIYVNNGNFGIEEL